MQAPLVVLPAVPANLAVVVEAALAVVPQGQTLHRQPAMALREGITFQAPGEVPAGLIQIMLERRERLVAAVVAARPIMVLERPQRAQAAQVALEPNGMPHTALVVVAAAAADIRQGQALLAVRVAQAVFMAAAAAAADGIVARTGRAALVLPVSSLSRIRQ